MSDVETLAAALGISVEKLETAIDQSGSLPDIERARYRALGFSIIEPDKFGALFGFSDRDWLPSSFLALKDGELQISLIAARYPGTGAFSRLLKRLDELVLRVRVVSPLPHMAEILLRKGFIAGHFGSTFEDRMDIWERPSEPHPTGEGERK